MPNAPRSRTVEEVPHFRLRHGRWQLFLPDMVPDAFEASGADPLDDPTALPQHTASETNLRPGMTQLSKSWQTVSCCHRQSVHAGNSVAMGSLLGGLASCEPGNLTESE